MDTKFILNKSKTVNDSNCDEMTELMHNATDQLGSFNDSQLKELFEAWYNLLNFCRMDPMNHRLLAGEINLMYNKAWRMPKRTLFKAYHDIVGSFDVRSSIIEGEYYFPYDSSRDTNPFSQF